MRIPVQNYVREVKLTLFMALPDKKEPRNVGVSAMKRQANISPKFMMNTGREYFPNSDQI